MYHAKLDLIRTEKAIKEVKDTFERLLAKALNLSRISAPLFVPADSGLNDNLNGVERPVSFDILHAGVRAEVVQSLAKWKRFALAKYGFEPHSGKMRSGFKHDGRSPDYDDWKLNGDIITWYPPLGCAFELSSMGIRVDEIALIEQLEAQNCLDRLKLPFHRALAAGELPLTMGGGIGQSRLCMLLLNKMHIGEVQVSVWDDKTLEYCREQGIELM